MKRVALILLALGMNAQAAALTLNDARAQGRVGETLSGYLAPIQQDAETLSLVNRINAARTESYQKLADSNNCRWMKWRKWRGKSWWPARSRAST